MSLPKIIRIIDGKKLSEEDNKKLKEILLRNGIVDDDEEISSGEDEPDMPDIMDGFGDSDRAELFRESMYYESRDRLIRRFANIIVSLALVVGITSLSNYFNSYWLMFFYVLPVALAW